MANGYRSGLEDKVAEQLRAAGHPVRYEEVRLGFTQPAKARTYRPDFVLTNGVVVETKGRFETDDRQKHKHIKEQHPNLDIRFVFSNPNARLSKGSPTTYAMWCEQYGFKWAGKLIPSDWLREPVCTVRLDALQAASKPLKK